MANSWKVEIQHRYPSVETGLGYYWTSVYYYGTVFGLPYDSPAWNAILDASYNGSTHDNQIVAIRVSDLDTGVVLSINTPPDNHGTIPEAGGGSLINVARLIGLHDGKPVSYKLWRKPFVAADIVGGQFSDSAWSLINDTILATLNSADFLNVNKVTIDEWVADRAVHMWQLRHGTKRRDRVVFAYP